LPPEGAPAVTFFVDRSLGGKLIVMALRAAGAVVVVHDEHFVQNTPDVEWLAEAGRRDWVVLTKDDAIRRNPLERDMYRTAGLRVFTLARRGLSGQEMAAIFVAALPGMLRRAETVVPPFVFSISRGGDFKRLD
jgi:predicted nuclease of predicted toxin-antitoxin system